MDNNKIIVPTTLGELEAEIFFSKENPIEIPGDSFCLFDVKGHIHPVAVTDSTHFRKDPFIDIYICEDNLKITFRLGYINTKKAEILEDEDYYHLKVSELVRYPKNKQIALHVTITATLAKIIFPGKPSKEDIIKRARAEMAIWQSHENPNEDGRFPKGTLYHWGGSR